MTENELKTLGPKLTLRPGASEEAIAQSEAALGIRFPDDYRAFLKTSNGATGFVASEDYIDLWPVEEIPKLSKDYAFEEFCPELVPFGSSGGGEGFCFHCTDLRILMMDFCSISIENALAIAPTFTQFMRKPLPSHWS